MLWMVESPDPVGLQSAPEETSVAAHRAQVAARLPDLLTLGPEENPLARLAELGASTPGGVLALVDALGANRGEAAGRILASVAAQAPDKALRKAARRGLHRLRAAGVKVADPRLAAASEPVRDAELEVAHSGEAHATPPDGNGSRGVWLSLERPSGGVVVFGLILNDSVGVSDASYRETTRKKFQQTLRSWRERGDMLLVSLPVEYALALISEALGHNRKHGTPIPTELQLHRRDLGELPPPPTDALIHTQVSRGQALLMPNLFEESPRLLVEEEMKDWYFDEEAVTTRALELQRLRESRIVLSGEPREVRERRIVDAAIEALFTPERRRAVRRRLEEVAWVFWQTGRERAARQAVAAAFPIEDGPSTRHPFVRALVEKSLELALEARRAGLDMARLRHPPAEPSAGRP